MPSPLSSRCLIILLIWLGAQTAAGRNSEPVDTTTFIPTPLVLMPLQNLSGYREPLQSVDSLLQVVMQEQGIELLTGGELRPLLKRNRIRSNGRVTAREAETIRLETGCNYLMICSINFYLPEPTPEIALSSRILQLSDQTIVRATSTAGSSVEQVKPFMQNSPYDKDRLIELVVRELIQELTLPVSPVDSSGTPYPRIVMIPFENSTGKGRTGEAVDNMLLSTLVRSGYNVMDPGLEHELFLQNGFLPVGEIDLETLVQLHELFKPDYLVTGCAEALLTAQEGSSGEGAMFEFTARVLEPSSGRLLAGRYSCRRGSDSELILGFGRVESTGRVMQDALAVLPELLDSLQSNRVSSAD
ncbi:MAG: hypothetical protein ISR91_06665 [Candidatus Delongbacteria bacterium]|nr:hypothetical protein [Candidatus Delongbacteria bacterium]